MLMKDNVTNIMNRWCILSNETDKSHQKLQNKGEQMRSNLYTTDTLGKDERGWSSDVAVVGRKGRAVARLQNKTRQLSSTEGASC